MPTYFIDAIVWLGKLIPFYVTLESCPHLWNRNCFMLTVVAFMDVSFGTCGIRILTQFVLLGGKLWEGFGICPLIHTVILSLNCLMRYLCTTLYANECYLLLPSVFIVTVTLIIIIIIIIRAHSPFRFRRATKRHQKRSLNSPNYSSKIVR